MTRTCVIAALTILFVTTSGCVTSDTLIKLNPDGSGTIVQKTLMSTEVISQLTAMMQGFAQQMTGNQQPPQEPKLTELFNEKDARSRAVKMGEGVSFVSSRKVKLEGMEGQEAIYAFSDITKLRLSEKPETPSVPGVQTKSSGGGETTFRFSRLPNGHSVLTAVFGKQTSKKASSDEAESTSPQTSKSTKAPTAEQLEQAKKLFAGFRIGLAVEVQGTLVNTNSVHREGEQVTLLEMDFSELLSNETLMRQAAAIKGQDLEEAKELLKRLKGFKINLDPEVTIEFSK
jgi:hypothetical protein